MQRSPPSEPASAGRGRRRCAARRTRIARRPRLDGRGLRRGSSAAVSAQVAGVAGAFGARAAAQQHESRLLAALGRDQEARELLDAASACAVRRGSRSRAPSTRRITSPGSRPGLGRRRPARDERHVGAPARARGGSARTSVSVISWAWKPVSDLELLRPRPSAASASVTRTSCARRRAAARSPPTRPGATRATTRWKLPRSSSFSASIGAAREVGEHVARLDAGLRGGRARRHAAHHHARFVRARRSRRRVRGRRAGSSTPSQPRSMPPLLELAHHVERGVDRDREADAAALAARVDADDAAVEIDERSARRAAVDHRVGLDEVVDAGRGCRGCGPSPTRSRATPCRRARRDCRPPAPTGRRARRRTSRSARPAAAASARCAAARGRSACRCRRSAPGSCRVTPGTVTVTFSAFSTTWWLVRMRPSLRRDHTRAGHLRCGGRSPCTIASTCTTDGVTRFEISITRSWSCVERGVRRRRGRRRRRARRRARSRRAMRAAAQASRFIAALASSAVAQRAAPRAARGSAAPSTRAGHRDARGARRGSAPLRCVASMPPCASSGSARAAARDRREAERRALRRLRERREDRRELRVVRAVRGGGAHFVRARAPRRRSSRSAPSSARAVATGSASKPRCTPSAPAASATSMRRFTSTRTGPPRRARRRARRRRRAAASSQSARPARSRSRSCTQSTPAATHRLGDHGLERRCARDAGRSRGRGSGAARLQNDASPSSGLEAEA